MQINFAEELRPEIDKSDLKVQGKYISEEKIWGSYLKGAYGNAYDFDQQDRLDVVF